MSRVTQADRANFKFEALPLTTIPTIAWPTQLPLKLLQVSQCTLEYHTQPQHLRLGCLPCSNALIVSGTLTNSYLAGLSDAIASFVQAARRCLPILPQFVLSFLHLASPHALQSTHLLMTPPDDSKPIVVSPTMTNGRAVEAEEPGARSMEAYLRMQSGSPPARAGYIPSMLNSLSRLRMLTTPPPAGCSNPWLGALPLPIRDLSVPRITVRMDACPDTEPERRLHTGLEL